jgi:hypothetical protein
MSNENKTHYRKAFNSPYLSSADIVGPTILTIARVELRPDETKKTKDHFNTAYFAEKELRPGEKLKPMILNAHNSKIMAGLCQSKFIDDWQNVRVTIYVDSNVRFGRDTVEGLRISPEQPQEVKRELTPGDVVVWERAVKSYRETGSLSKVSAAYAISDENAEKLKSLAFPNGKTE